MRASQALEASSTLVARSRDESIFFYIHAKKHENMIEAPFIKVSYDDAWHLLTRYTQGDALRYHARQVQSAMAYFATVYHEDPEVWGVAGMLHDLDYEMYPDSIALWQRKLWKKNV